MDEALPSVAAYGASRVLKKIRGEGELRRNAPRLTQNAFWLSLSFFFNLRDDISQAISIHVQEGLVLR